MNAKDVKGSDPGLFQDTIQECTWIDEEHDENHTRPTFEPSISRISG